MSSENSPAPVVLVVEDEALIRWSLREGLTAGGYAVRLAASAAEARAALGACGPGPLVVLLDLRLPDSADLSLLRHVRAVRPDAAVLMMTAHGTSEDAAEALTLGAVHFLGKPFDVGELVRLVDGVWKNR